MWGNIIKVGNDIDKLGINFSESFGKKVGEGGSMRFWTDKWMGNFNLLDKFPRLFRLDTLTVIARV